MIATLQVLHLNIVDSGELYVPFSLRSMAVLSSRAQVAPAPISSRFLCPRPPLLLSSPNQNRHATQAMYLYNPGSYTN